MTSSIPNSLSNSIYVSEAHDNSSSFGDLGPKKIDRSTKCKPLFIVLVILGICGIAVVGVGIAGLGASQSLWSVGLLNNLGQVNSIVTICVGGSSSIIFLLGGKLVLNKKEPFQLSELDISEEFVENSVSSAASIYESAAEVSGSSSLGVSQDKKSLAMNLTLLMAVISRQLDDQILFKTNEKTFIAKTFCGAICIQNFDDYNADNENYLKISLKDFKITSIENSSTNQVFDEIPEDFIELLNAAFRKALEMSSDYKIERYFNSELNINLIRHGLQEIPKYHLSQLAEKLLSTIQQERADLKISVNYLKEKNLNRKRGRDFGGLARDYLDELFTGLCHSQEFSFLKATSGYLLPKTQEKYKDGGPLPVLNLDEQQDFEHIGIVLMHCYRSRSGSSSSNKLCVLGRHFDDALFKAALSLTAKEIDTPFEDLSFVTKLKMCRALAEAQGAKIYLRWIDLLSKDQLSETELEEAAQILVCEEMLPEELKDGDEQPDVEKITTASGCKSIISGLTDLVFGREGSLGQMGTQLAPIYAIARGMKSFEPRNWEEISETPYRFFSLKVQGSLDRTLIADQLYFEPVYTEAVNKEITKKLNWHKEWLLDDEHGATDQEMKSFLKFATGAACLLPDNQIRIKAQDLPFVPAPKSHTCYLQLDFSPDPCAMGEFNDYTKENFIKALKEIALTDMEFETDL